MTHSISVWYHEIVGEPKANMNKLLKNWKRMAVPTSWDVMFICIATFLETTNDCLSAVQFPSKS